MNRDDVLGIYEIYVQTIVSAESRRQQISAVYTSLIAAGLVFASSEDSSSYVMVSILVFAISLSWLLSIMYFRALSKSKFYVIGEIEREWTIKPFQMEWNHFSNHSGYIFTAGLTIIEMGVPIFTMVSSLTYALYKLLFENYLATMHF